MIVNNTNLLLRSLKTFWRHLLLISIFSFSVYVVDYFVDHLSFGIPTGSLQVFGIVLSLLLVFRSNQAYDRWWEARKIWGEIVNKSRSWGMQVDSLLTVSVLDTSLSQSEIESFKKKLVYRQIAFIYVLKQQLRKLNDYEEAKAFLSRDEFDMMHKYANKATYLNMLQLKDLKKVLNTKEQGVLTLLEMNRTLKELFNCQGMCERIKNTVFPVPYTFLTNWVVNCYAVVLPVYLIGEFWMSSKSSLDWFAAPLSIIITFTFVTLDSVATMYKNPFENAEHDTPMTSLCRTIEIDLRQMLGEQNLPDPIKVEKGVLM